MNRRKIATITATLVVGVLTVVVVVSMSTGVRRGHAYGSDGDQPAQTDAARPLRVEVTQPERRTMTRNLRMPASLLPGEAADLFAKVSGYISTISVDIGSRVSKGDALLNIDIPEMVDELHQAQAVLAAKRARIQALRAKVDHVESKIATARAQVESNAADYDLWKITTKRKGELQEANAISRQELDESKGRLAVAHAQLRIAKAKVTSADAEKRAIEADVAVAEAEVGVEEAVVARLRTLMKYATIRAPFDGVITDRFVDPGAFVRSAADGTTKPLLTIANISYIRLTLEIPESDAPFVRVGTEVEIDVKALRGEPIRASITRTASALKPNTRTMRTEVDLDNSSGRLAPGMYAQVIVKLESKAQALMIPSKAIRVRGRDVSVYVVDGGVARTAPVEIGYDDGIWAEIVKGLAGDEWIITSGGSALFPGAPVEPVPIKATGASS